MPAADTTLTGLQPFYACDTIPWQQAEPEVNLGLPLDSIYRPYEPAATTTRQSLFVPRALQPQHDTLVARHTDVAPTWLFVLLVVLCALTHLYYSIRKLKIGELAATLVDHRAMERLVRNANLTPIRMAPMGLLAVAALCTAVHQAFLPDSGLTGWLTLTLAGAALYMLRWGFVRLLGNVFYCVDAVGVYIASSYLYHIAYATAMLPLLFLFAYLPWGGQEAFYAIVGLTLLTFVVRTMRGIKVFLTFSTSTSFYLFYYLCTAEMVPAIIVLRWFAPL